jgi:hypothetical protein
MKILIWILVIALIVVHQDNWNWDDQTLRFGFMPIGLFYHACLSLAAGFVWFLACQFAWPKELAEVEESQSKPVGGGGQH